MTVPGAAVGFFHLGTRYSRVRQDTSPHQKLNLDELMEKSAQEETVLFSRSTIYTGEISVLHEDYEVQRSSIYTATKPCSSRSLAIAIGCVPLYRLCSSNILLF